MAYRSVERLLALGSRCQGSNPEQLTLPKIKFSFGEKYREDEINVPELTPPKRPTGNTVTPSWWRVLLSFQSAVRL